MPKFSEYEGKTKTSASASAAHFSTAVRKPTHDIRIYYLFNFPSKGPNFSISSWTCTNVEHNMMRSHVLPDPFVKDQCSVRSIVGIVFLF